MTLLSTLGDFVSRTLAALPGAWGKLRYMAELREVDGRYSHWGMERIHGEAAVQRALAEAHQSVFLEVLRTPLRDLLDDAAIAASEQGVPPSGYLQDLGAAPALLPPDLVGGSARHFNSVLLALSHLARGRSRANRRVA